jgi:aminopeptidase YwaD
VRVPGLFAAVLAAAVFALAPGATRPAVCADCVKANMERLAGDELRGRACGSEDEHAAARFVADTLRRSKIAGAFGRDVYLQPVQLLTPTAGAPATLEITAGERQFSLLQGRDLIAVQPPEALEAPVVRVIDAHADPAVVRGKVVVYDSSVFDPPGIRALQKAGAAAVVSPASDQIVSRWKDLARRPPAPTQIVGVERAPPTALGPAIYATGEAMAQLRALGEGASAKLSAPRGPVRERTTYNVMGVLHGKARDADRHALLLSAHYDHLGVREGAIFHGANDDASGTAAVLEFARILGSGRRHGRTVYFGLFGCEEEGELGAQYFEAHPPMVIEDLMANLEFEMIGVDDPKRPGALMLTGWDRTDLGPALEAHGARVGPDLYPEEQFFQRSDNYQLALHGVIAQTVSAWPLPPTYHRVTDDLAHVDLAFMDTVIGSMVGPVVWLLDSDFQPAWNPGKQP